MNVFLLISAMDCGGAETHVYTLARAMAHRGHRVTVISSGGAMAERLLSEGIRHVSLPLHSRNPAQLLLARRKLKRLLRAAQDPVVHAHSRIAALVAQPLAKKLKVPFVTTIHAKFQSDPIRRRLSRWGTHPIAVSEDLKHELCQTYRIFPDRVTVIPNGIELPLRQADPDPDRLRLVFCSRLDFDCARGAFCLCEIASRLRQRFPTLEILLVGGGNALPLLRQVAERLNTKAEEDYVRCVGAVEDPSALFATAHGVVGVSRVALEAMAVGVPVILGGNEGFLGLADENTLPLAELTNLCCRGESPMTEDRLYDACLCLLSQSEEDRRQTGRRLAAFVRNTHDAQKIAAETEAVYKRAAVTTAHTRGSTVFCGYYGYGNTGDEALLRAAIQRATEEGLPTPFSALTRRGRRDAKEFGIRCVRRASLYSVTRELGNGSTVIFGGGTLLQDETSLRSLCYYAALIGYARLRGGRVELWANGIQSPRTAMGDRLLRAALCRCDAIGLRDQASLSLAKSILGKETPIPIRYEPDLACATPSAPSSRISYLQLCYGVTSRIAIIAPKGGAGRGLIKILSDWLCVLRAEGVQLWFVPMYPREDEPLCRQLATHSSDRILRGLSPADLVGLMARCEVICGMRLHALIFAAAAKTPFVCFSAESKLEVFCREHGGIDFTRLYS